MRRFGIISILLLGSSILTSCGNRTELNELGIVTASGIDGKEGAWSVTYQIIIPSAMSTGTGGSGGGGSQSAVHTFSTEGKTIREAIDITNLENPRKLYFAHNNILLIGKEAADSGIDEIVDNYLRNFESRESVKVVIANEKARDLLKQMVPPEKLPGVALAKILNKDTKVGSFFPSVTMFDIAQGITSEHSCIGVPEISVVGSGSDKLDSIDVFQKTSTKIKLKLTGLSVFKGPKRVGTLKREESQGVSWLTNRMKSSTLSFEEKDPKTGVKSYSAFQVTKAHVKAVPIKGPSHFTLKVTAHVYGELLESTSQVDISKPEGIYHLEQQVDKKVVSQMELGWASMQKLNVDLVGIANMIHRQYPKDWAKIKDSWFQELQRMDMKVEVHSEISRPGLIQKSYTKVLGPNKDK